MHKCCGENLNQVERIKNELVDRSRKISLRKDSSAGIQITRRSQLSTMRCLGERARQGESFCKDPKQIMSWVSQGTEEGCGC